METNQVVNSEEKKEIRLRKKDLLKSFAIWELTSEMCLNYERLMALGFCHAMTPILKRLYPNKEDLSAALTRHMAFFNTENQWGAIIPGIVASLEEERANGADLSDDMDGMLAVGKLLPTLGLALLVKAIFKGKFISFLIIGYVLSAFFELSIIPVTLFGLAFALLFWHFGSKEDAYNGD